MTISLLLHLNATRNIYSSQNVARFHYAMTYMYVNRYDYYIQFWSVILSQSWCWYQEALLADAVPQTLDLSCWYQPATLPSPLRPWRYSLLLRCIQNPKSNSHCPPPIAHDQLTLPIYYCPMPVAYSIILSSHLLHSSQHV